MTTTFASLTRVLGVQVTRRHVMPGVSMLTAGTLGILGFNTAEAGSRCRERCTHHCVEKQRNGHKGNHSRRCRNTCQNRCR